MSDGAIVPGRNLRHGAVAGNDGLLGADGCSAGNGGGDGHDRGGGVGDGDDFNGGGGDDRLGLGLAELGAVGESITEGSLSVARRKG